MAKNKAVEKFIFHTKPQRKQKKLLKKQKNVEKTYNQISTCKK